MAKSKSTESKMEVKSKSKPKPKGPDMYVCADGIASARPAILPGVEFNPRDHETHDRKPMADKVADLVERGIFAKVGD